MASLSVVIITHNEEKNIGRCIASVKQIADEIVVMDSFSKDQTARIAAELGAKCYFRVFSGYGDQKNAAAQMATHEYLLYLDADEYLSPELNESMLQEKARNFPCDGYYMNRLSFYFGRWIRHCSWYPDRKLRLVRRDKAVWSSDLVHESLDPVKDAALGMLKGDLLHLPYADQEIHVAKIDRYSTLGAQILLEKNKTGKTLGAFLYNTLIIPSGTFIWNFFFRGGFRDGREGLLLHLYHSTYTSWKYSKARQIARKR